MDVFHGCDLTWNEQFFLFFPQLTHLRNSETVIQQLSRGQNRAILLSLTQIWLDFVLQIINTYMHVLKDAGGSKWSCAWCQWDCCKCRLNPEDIQSYIWLPGVLEGLNKREEGRGWCEVDTFHFFQSANEWKREKISKNPRGRGKKAEEGKKNEFSIHLTSAQTAPSSLETEVTQSKTSVLTFRPLILWSRRGSGSRHVFTPSLHQSQCAASLLMF